MAEPESLSDLIAPLAARREEFLPLLAAALRPVTADEQEALHQAAVEWEAWMQYLQRPQAALAEARGAFWAGRATALPAALSLGQTLRHLVQATGHDPALVQLLEATDAYYEAWINSFVRVYEAGHLRRLEERASRYAARLQVAAEVSRAASSILNLRELLETSVELIRAGFDYYYVGLFLLDDAGRYAVLRAGTGEAGRKMLEAGHKLAVGETSMIGWCILHGEPRISFDVGEEAVRFSNPYLPLTRSEMALPLIARGKVIGALTIQSSAPQAFSQEDITVLQTVADQLANAITNARLYAEAQERLQQLQEIQRRSVGEAWSAFEARRALLGYRYNLTDLEPLDAPVFQQPPEPVLQGQPTIVPHQAGTALLSPVQMREQVLGLFSFADPEQAREWSEEDLALVSAVSEQMALALENRLFFEQSQQSLAQTRLLYELGQRMAQARTVQELLQVAVEGVTTRPEPARVVAGLLLPLEAPTELQVLARWQRTPRTQPLQSNVFNLKAFGFLMEELAREGCLTIPDLMADPRVTSEMRQMYTMMRVRGMVLLALKQREQLYGTLMIYTSQPHEFSQEELQFYQSLVQSASVSLDNMTLLDATRSEAERRALLNEVLQTASRSLDTATLFNDVGQLLAQRLQLTVLAFRREKEDLILGGAYQGDGTPVTAAPELRVPIAELPGLAWAIDTQEPLLTVDFRRALKHPDLLGLMRTLHIQEIFVVPVVARDQARGVLLLARRSDQRRIDEEMRTFLRVAMVNVGVALENARLYEEAQETAERLKEVDRLKTEFLANMSHELRTPLNSIIGFSRVILKGIDGPLTEMQQTDLQAIYESGQHLLGLINSILDLSKIEAGKMELSFEPCNLKDIIRTVMSASVALVKDKPVQLLQDVPEDLPTIIADSQRIRQVLLNLMSNAAKFTDHGFIRLRVTHDAERVIISVEDTGIGIPREAWDKVFEKFTQVDSSSTRKYGGTGLGLPISREFVRMHGGDIWLESVVGQGTTFYVSLPIHGPSKEQQEKARVEREQREQQEAQPVARRVVLAVDDDPGVIQLFRRYLERRGYNVVGTSHPENVVAEAKRLRPYAITLDILMPNRDGWQVIQDLKSDPETRSIPIIVCSIVNEVGKGLSMGVSEYLVKPIMEQDLLDALARLETLGGAQVLVVDDTEDDRRLLARILTDAGYQVREASGGAEALAAIRQSMPSLILLDLMMPEVDGFAVLEALKADEIWREIPVIVVTAKELTPQERADLNQRVQALLQKGLFSQEQLLWDVAEALDRLAQRMQSAAQTPPAEA